MSRKSLILLVVVAFALSLGIGVSMGFANPEEITINADGKKPAKFPHKAHQENAKLTAGCATCHHTSADGKVKTPVEGTAVAEDGSAKCDSCHKDGFANEKLAKWKDIGHGLCKDCHTKMKEDGAPTKCNDCHIKK